MARVNEIIRARSEREAIEQIASLYGTLLIDYRIEARRTDSGKFSPRGRNFYIKVTYEEPEEQAPEELGEDEY